MSKKTKRSAFDPKRIGREILKRKSKKRTEVPLREETKRWNPMLEEQPGKKDSEVVTEKWSPMAENYRAAREAPEKVAEHLLESGILTDTEKTLILRLLDRSKKEFSKDDFADFIKMDAGTRELSIELLKSCMEEYEFTAKTSESALSSLMNKMRYHFPEATETQKREAVLLPSNLSEEQQSIIRSVLGVDSSKELQKEDVEKFLKGVSRLDSRKRALLWRKNYIDFYTFGQFMVSLRNAFENWNVKGVFDSLSVEEKHFASFLSSKKTSDTDLKDLYDRLKFFENIVYYPKEEWSKEQRKLVEKLGSFGTKKMISPIKRYRDYRILLEFAGIELMVPEVEIKERASTFPKFKMKGDRIIKDEEGNPVLEKTNGDSAISADVFIPWNNRKMKVDAVFDGVGGGFTRDGKKLDHLASDIARDMLKVAIRSGVVEKPEDFLVPLYAADMAIRVYAIAKLSEDKNIPQHFGSTAAISTVEGRKFTAITTGDSRWMVFDSKGNPKFKSKDHSAYEVVNNENIWNLPRSKYEMIKMQATNMCEEELRGRIIASLGVGGPMDLVKTELEKGDVVVTVSDGISDLICEHMIGDAIKDKKDPDSAADTVFDIVDTLIEEGGDFPDCNCWLMETKNDDKSFTIQWVKE